ncbi:MAG: dihydrofolate reductase family protein [Chloroflexota bacterium]|nr:dihydrofolate reductase family protein [Chloroflexota bacterium]
MAKVLLGMTVSLDGFVNDRDGGVGRLFPDLGALRETEAMREAIRTTGAVVMGRRAYEMGPDYTGYEFQVPIFVLTHRPPERPATGENDRLTFTFVSDGIESAVRQARVAAGDRDVAVIGGANTAQQALRAGLVDELQIDVRPVLLGGGLRLFEHLDDAPLELERIGVRESPTTTDLRFRVLR